MANETNQKTKELQQERDKRLQAAMRENLKKRKAFQQKSQQQQNKKEDSQ